MSMNGKFNVAIFGVGPSALAAAHAVVVSGGTFDLFTRMRAGKSKLYGCQYLHAPIPQVPNIAEAVVSYELHGTPEEYKQKVYGSLKVDSVSPEELAETHKAWDIRATYDWLWRQYVHPLGGLENSHDFEVTHDNIAKNAKVLTQDFDLVISTVPAPALCAGHHVFNSNRIWAMGDSDNRDVPLRITENSVICNGLPEPAWYRISNVFGMHTIEWSVVPPIPDTALVEKPLSTNCNCHPWIERIGRYGAWKKAKLVHDAYDDTVRLINQIRTRRVR